MATSLQDISRPRILWADDNTDTSKHVGRLLLSRYDLMVVSDGATALEAALALPPDLILTDVTTPGLDGFELLRKLRADERTQATPIILLSARAGDDAAVEGLEAGADDYLVKPFSARELMARVGTHLELSSLRRAMTAEIQSAEDLALKAARQKSDFLANMSHGIRTTLNGIIGMVDLVLRTDLASRQQDLLVMARTSADSLLSILNDILDSSEIEAGRLGSENASNSRKSLNDSELSGTNEREPDNLEPQDSVHPPSLGSLLSGSTCKLRILLAEDNPINQVLATTLLEGNGHDVRVANNGREAFAMTEEEMFDLVLMDVLMPIMDGVEATVLIRQREQRTGAHLPIFAITANAMKGDREKYLAAGMDDYISKPINSEDFLATIDRVSRGLGAAAVSEMSEPWSFRKAFDVDKALARTTGNKTLLKKLIRLFFEERARLMPEIQNAIAQQDVKTLQLHGHTLKSSIGIFSGGVAFEAAARLEAIAREGETSKAESVYQTLGKELDGLEAELREYLEA